MTRSLGRAAVLAAALASAAGCASAPQPGTATDPAGAANAPAQAGAAGARTQAGAAEQPLIPAGLGTLRQDEVTVQIRSGALLIKVTPLEEGVIRLLAPDTYERLHALAASRRAEAATHANADAPELFLVSFFSYEPDVAFQPEDLQITYQGRILRAAAILPVTGGFGRQRLAQQENQSAVYAFDQKIDYAQPFVVRYGFEQSDDWVRILPKLEVERARVRARGTSR